MKYNDRTFFASVGKFFSRQRRPFATLSTSQKKKTCGLSKESFLILKKKGKGSLLWLLGISRGSHSSLSDTAGRTDQFLSPSKLFITFSLSARTPERNFSLRVFQSFLNEHGLNLPGTWSLGQTHHSFLEVFINTRTEDRRKTSLRKRFRLGGKFCFPGADRFDVSGRFVLFLKRCHFRVLPPHMLLFYIPPLVTSAGKRTVSLRLNNHPLLSLSFLNLQISFLKNTIHKNSSFH